MQRLIEEVEAQKFHETDGYVMREGFNSGIDTAIAVIRQHASPQGVDEAELLKVMVQAYYAKKRERDDAGRTDLEHVKLRAVIEAIRPYLRPQPAQPQEAAGDVVRSALKRLVDLKAHKDAHGKNNWYVRNQKDAWEQAKAALQPRQACLSPVSDKPACLSDSAESERQTQQVDDALVEAATSTQGKIRRAANLAGLTCEQTQIIEEALNKAGK